MGQAFDAKLQTTSGGSQSPLVDESFRQPAVRGVLHPPVRENGKALVLTHGAGSNSESPLLVSLAEFFAASGFLVLRCDLPFRQARPHGPPSGNGALDRKGLQNALNIIRKLGPKHVFLGGQSYGGRQASMLAAEEPGTREGLLLLSYPLHAPGRSQFRTQHFPGLKKPVLFVHGEWDPFASREELESARKLIPARTELLEVPKAGHDLGFNRARDAAFQELPHKIVEVFQVLTG
jgi:predicted alpha/beta-hydrolase family hydrolase